MVQANPVQNRASSMRARPIPIGEDYLDFKRDQVIQGQLDEKGKLKHTIVTMHASGLANQIIRHVAHSNQQLEDNSGRKILYLCLMFCRTYRLFVPSAQVQSLPHQADQELAPYHAQALQCQGQK